MSKIACTYEIDDGYVGGSRPQRFNVDPEDFRDMSYEQMAALLDEIAHEEMQQRVTACVLRVQETIEDITAALAKADAE